MAVADSITSAGKDNGLKVLYGLPDFFPKNSGLNDALYLVSSAWNEPLPRRITKDRSKRIDFR